MEVTSILTTAVVATLLIELVKFGVRKFKKDENFDLAPEFYWVSLPVAQLFAQPLLIWLGVLPAVALTLSLQTVILVLLESLASVLLYDNGLKPLKSYTKAYRNGN